MGHALYSQNLVPNPGFEDFGMCPPYLGQVHLAAPWNSPNNKTTDFYHRCSSSSAGVPDNLMGVQKPFHGDGYLGLRAWIPVISGNPAYREYATAPLLEPLREGERYVVSFWLSMAERSSHRSDGLGIWFSADYPRSDSVYLLIPDIRHPSGRIIHSVDEWVQVRGIYEARGDERYLTIGNFGSDQEMIRESVRPEEQPTVYYYLDAVHVEPCGKAQEDRSIDTLLCRGEPLLLSAHSGAWEVKWDNGSVSQQRLVTSPGTYKLTMDLGCYRQELTYKVSGHDCNCQIRQRNASGMAGSWTFPSDLRGFDIRVFDVAGHQWGANGRDGFVEISEILPSGLYFFEAILQCGDKTGTPQTGQFIITRL